MLVCCSRMFMQKAGFMLLAIHMCLTLNASGKDCFGAFRELLLESSIYKASFCLSLRTSPFLCLIILGVWPFAIATLLFIVFLAKSVTIRRKRTHKLPPGSRAWPLVGDSFSWYNAVASSHPPRFVEEQVKRYGKIFSCSLFGKWAVVSADPSFNRFIMQNEGKLFQSSYPKSFRDLVGKNGVITVQGEQQRTLHGIASNMMRLDRLKFHFLGDIQKVMLQTLNNFPNNRTILLQDECRKLAINLMVNQLLGVLSESEINEMAQLFSDFVDGCLSVPINLPGFAFHTNDAVADFIINLLFAGNETTAKTMLFAIHFLTQCPKAMKQLLEEQNSVRSNSGDEILTWEDYKAMPFTQCVIDETLRLGGIAIWLMREAKEDVTYQDFVIPKGCFVVPFLSAVHLDENLYKGALTFNPWRWMDRENEVRQTVKFFNHCPKKLNMKEQSILRLSKNFVMKGKEKLEKQPILLSLWRRRQVLSRSRVGSPSDCSVSALLRDYIQMDPTQRRSNVLLSLCPISERIRDLP